MDTPEKTNELLSVTQFNAEIKNKSPAFVAHWFLWTIVIGAISGITLFNIGNSPENRNSIIWVIISAFNWSLLFTLFTSWLPAVITLKIGQASYKKTLSIAPDPYLKITDQMLVDMIDKEISLIRNGTPSSWLNENWSNLKDKEKIQWVSVRRAVLIEQLKLVSLGTHVVPNVIGKCVSLSTNERMPTVNSSGINKQKSSSRGVKSFKTV